MTRYIPLTWDITYTYKIVLIWSTVLLYSPETYHNAVTYRERLPRVSGRSKRLPSVGSSDSWHDQRYNGGEEIQTTLVDSMITLVDRQDSSAK